MRYGELKRKILNINKRALTIQIREQEECKVVNRKVYNELPLKVKYTLTEMG